MLIIRRRAHARAGLVGNPSDGYGGKTLSVIVRNFSAECILYEWEDVELVWTDLDQSRFGSVHELVRDVQLHGYYGGMRLVKATVKKFVEYCVRHGFLPYNTDASEPTEVFHNDIRGRFNRGEPVVVQAMERCASLAATAREALLAGNADRFGKCIDENFEQRRSIYQLSARQVEM